MQLQIWIAAISGSTCALKMGIIKRTLTILNSGAASGNGKQRLTFLHCWGLALVPASDQGYQKLCRQPKTCKIIFSTQEKNLVDRQGTTSRYFCLFLILVTKGPGSLDLSICLDESQSQVHSRGVQDRCSAQIKLLDFDKAASGTLYQAYQTTSLRKNKQQ